MSVNTFTVTDPMPDTRLNPGAVITWIETDDVRPDDLAVVEIVPSGVIVYRYVRAEGDEVVLTPKDPTFPAGTFSRENVKVLGYVVSMTEPSILGLAGLRIRGDDFRDALLNDGDILTFVVSSAAKPGEHVVAYLMKERQTVVRTYLPESGRIRLVAFVRGYPDIVAPNDNLIILGRMVAAIRQF